MRQGGVCLLGGIGGAYGALAGGRGDAIGIEDHDDAAIAENRVARIKRDVPEDLRHGFDHDFFRVEHLVDHDAEGIGPHLGDDDEDLVVGTYLSFAHFKEIEQRHQGQEAVAQSQEGRIVDHLDRVLRVGRCAYEFQHTDLRNGKALAAAFDDQRRNDRQRQRNLDCEGGAPAGHGLQLDGAADLFDVGAHHVHADAAARNAGHLLRRREPGFENKLLDFHIAHALQLGLAGKAVFEDLGRDSFGIETPPVVGDLDDDVAALVVGVEPDRAGFRLARLPALLRRLQAVIRGVADHVRQRILDQLENLAVQFGFGADHLHFDLLARLHRKIAHDSRQLGPGIADGLHAGLHHPFLQVRGDQAEALQGGLELAVILATHHLHELVAGQHHLADQGHQILEHLHVDPNGLGRHRGFLGRALLRGGGGRLLRLGGSRGRLRAGFGSGLGWRSRVAGGILSIGPFGLDPGHDFVVRARLPAVGRGVGHLVQKFLGNREPVLGDRRRFCRRFPGGGVLFRSRSPGIRYGGVGAGGALFIGPFGLDFDVRGRLLALGGGFGHFVQQFLGNREPALGDRRRVCRRFFGGGMLLRPRFPGFRYRRFIRRRGFRGCRDLATGQRVQLVDQLLIAAFGLRAGLLELAEQGSYGIDAPENQGHRARRDLQSPIPKIAQNVLPGMGDRFEPGQAQKAAGPLDRMDQPEDILKDRSVLGILLELHQFDVENRKALGTFREEFV